jgi:hypothetical protein
VLACAVAILLVAPAPASASTSAQPVVTALTTCGYSGSQFALVGREFAPGQNATVDVMPTADPRTGEPTSTRAVTADDAGRFSVLLDVPASEGRHRSLARCACGRIPTPRRACRWSLPPRS